MEGVDWNPMSPLVMHFNDERWLGYYFVKRIIYQYNNVRTCRYAFSSGARVIDKCHNNNNGGLSDLFIYFFSDDKVVYKRDKTICVYNNIILHAGDNWVLTSWSRGREGQRDFPYAARRIRSGRKTSRRRATEYYTVATSAKRSRRVHLRPRK